MYPAKYNLIESISPCRKAFAGTLHGLIFLDRLSIDAQEKLFFWLGKLDKNQYQVAEQSIILILEYLKRIAHYGDTFYVSLRKIAESVNLNLKTVHKWILRLIQSGLVNLKTKGCWFDRLANVYFFQKERVVHFFSNVKNGIFEFSFLSVSHCKKDRILSIHNIFSKMKEEFQKQSVKDIELNCNPMENEAPKSELLDNLNKQCIDNPYVTPLFPDILRYYNKTKDWVKTVQHFRDKNKQTPINWLKQPDKSLRPRCSCCNNLMRLKVNLYRFFGSVFWSCQNAKCKNTKCFSDNNSLYKRPDNGVDIPDWLPLLDRTGVVEKPIVKEKVSIRDRIATMRGSIKFGYTYSERELSWLHNAELLTDKEKDAEFIDYSYVDKTESKTECEKIDVSNITEDSLLAMCVSAYTIDVNGKITKLK